MLVTYSTDTYADITKSLSVNNLALRYRSEVSMAHRGLALIDLLTAAAKADSRVMWK